MELIQLQKFADATHAKVYTSTADLDPKDKPMAEMLTWCKNQGDIVVLKNGLILSCNPTSRTVQNCKIVLLNKGLTYSSVVPATQSLIIELLANLPTGVEPRAVVKLASEQNQRLRLLVREALQAKASSIHIEVRSENAKIRFRKYGQLYLHAEWLAKLAREITVVAFNKEMDQAENHFNPLIPQYASLSLKIDNDDIRLQIASLPAHLGFDVVIRVLTTDTARLPPLQELGYDAKQIELLTKCVRSLSGVVLVAGPAASAKKTLVATCLQTISPHRKVYTIEEKAEKLLSDSTQVPVAVDGQDQNMGRAVLRMDPDVIFIEQVNQEEGARLMCRAALSGHLVFSTIRTQSATGIITRLIEMGISPQLLADKNVLQCLIIQRLVPILCLNCAKPLNKSETHIPFIKRWQSVFSRGISHLKARGEGCDSCEHTGVSHRTVIADIIWLDDKSREFIRCHDMTGWEKYLRKQGLISIYEQAIELVRKGRSDPLDIERIIGDIHKRDVI